MIIEKNFKEQVIEITKYNEANLSQTRARHSLSVAITAQVLGLELGNLDTEKLYLAGLLHDISKELPIDSMKKELLLEGYRIADDILDYEVHSLHSIMQCKRIFGTHDGEILQAIRNHTVPTLNMTSFDKIIFCADKLEPNRNYGDDANLEKNRILDLCAKDIDKGFVETMQFLVEHVMPDYSERDVEVFRKIYEFYKEEI